MNKRKLKGKIVEVYGSQRNFCRETGFPRHRLNYMTSETTKERRPTLPDAAWICRALELTKDEYFDIFVNPYNQKEE